jgi:hypothetical protein
MVATVPYKYAEETDDAPYYVILSLRINIMSEAIS